MSAGELVFFSVLAVSIAAFVYSGWLAGRVWSRAYREHFVVKAGQLLKEIFISVPAPVLHALNLGTVVLFYVVFSWYFGTWVFGVLGGAVGLFIPSQVIRALRRKWLNKIDAQFPQTLTVLANSLRSGLALPQAAAIVTEESLPPLRDELAIMLHEQQVGVPAIDAVKHLAARVPTEEMKLFASAVGLTLQTGGSLADVLSSLADTIRERQRLRGKVDALTAQGRMEALVVAAMPFVVFLMMSLFDSEMTLRLFEIMLGPISLGRLLLAIVLGLELIAFLWIRKIMNIDI